MVLHLQCSNLDFQKFQLSVPKKWKNASTFLSFACACGHQKSYTKIFSHGFYRALAKGDKNVIFEEIEKKMHFDSRLVFAKIPKF